MRQIKLMPREAVAVVRKGAEGKFFATFRVEHEDVHYCEPPIAFVPGERFSSVSFPKSVFCRCCGYVVEQGERVIPVKLWAAPKFRFIHERKCQWGAAHDETPMQSTGAANPGFRRQRAITTARKNKATRDAEFQRQQREFGNIGGPVTVRFVDPATLRKQA